MPAKNSTENILPSKDQLPKNYELLEVLGAGAFGEVLKCIKRDTNEIVAVKVPHPKCNMDSDVCKCIQLFSVHS